MSLKIKCLIDILQNQLLKREVKSKIEQYFEDRF